MGLSLAAPRELTNRGGASCFAKHVPEEVLAFGKVEGFVINYTPDHAIRFDLLGNPVETLGAAYRRGAAQMNDILDLSKVIR